MDRQEAIRWYETKLAVNAMLGFDGPQNDTARLAVKALQEKEEREKGCEYCKGPISKCENHHAIKTPNGWVVETEMRYCWNCGRELEVE